VGRSTQKGKKDAQAHTKPDTKKNSPKKTTRDLTLGRNKDKNNGGEIERPEPRNSGGEGEHTLRNANRVPSRKRKKKIGLGNSSDQKKNESKVTCILKKHKESSAK